MTDSAVVCPKCQSTYFTQIVAFNKVSALRSKSGREELHANPSYICVGCGGPLEAALKTEAPQSSTEFDSKSELILSR